jgi:long-chain fatty acid transport protein
MARDCPVVRLIPGAIIGRQTSCDTESMKRPIIPILAGIAAAASPVHATETLSTVPDSAVALGMSGGRHANLTDPSAIHYTPANIAGIERMQAEINFQAWNGDVEFKQAGSGETVKMQDPWKVLGSFYFATPIVPGEVAFGLGVTTPYGLDSQWPHHGPLRYLIPYEATLVTLDISPVIAFKPVRNVSVGVGLDIMYSSLRLRQFYPWSALTPGLPINDGIASYDAEGWGIGAFAGITWEITPHQRLTLIGRLPVEIDYEGDFRISKVPRFLEGSGLGERSEFKSNIKFPATVAAGYGIDLTDRLTAGVDFLWAQNSTHDGVPLDIGPNQALLGGSTGLTLNWQDSITVGAGVQYALDSWTLRAGYMYSENSIPDATYTPSVPSNDRHLFSAGIGYRTDRHSFNVGYSYSYFPERTVSGNVQPAFDGTYKIGWHVLSASYVLSF